MIPFLSVWEELLIYCRLILFLVSEPVLAVETKRSLAISGNLRNSLITALDLAPAEQRRPGNATARPAIIISR